MVNHYVMFRLEGDNAAVAEAALKFKNAIEALVFTIPQLIAASVNINENPAEQWTMVLTSQVENWDDLAVYASHPSHLAAVALIKPMIAGRACVDFVS